MGRNQSNRRSILPLFLDGLALITATFGSILSNYKILSLVLGIITCIILIALLAKELGAGGIVIGILISIGLMILMIMQVLKAPADGFSDKISGDTKLGSLELCVEELVVGYRDKDGNKKITAELNVEKNMCDSIILKSIDYDIVLEKYKVQDGKIVFSNIPAGTYDVRIQLNDFSLYSGTIKLKESDLSNNIWRKTVCVQADNDYKEMQIIITDSDGALIKGYKCDFNVLGTEYEIKDIVSDADGKLPYVFSMPSNVEFQLTLHYDNEKTYTNKYLVSEVDNPLYVQFSTPPKEKIPVTEVHQPDDVATIVSLPE